MMKPKFSKTKRNDRKKSGKSFFRSRRKMNRFLSVFSADTKVVDYKDTERLIKFTTEKGKIIPRRITGLTSKQQRVLARAIRKARQAGLLAYQRD